MSNTQICPQLLAILACPACHASLREIGKELVCANPACALHYPVRAGIPVLLVDEARRAPATGTEVPMRSTKKYGQLAKY